MMQPAVQPVSQPVEQPAVSCIQIFNRLSNRLNNRFYNWLYRVNGKSCKRVKAVLMAHKIDCKIVGPVCDSDGQLL